MLADPNYDSPANVDAAVRILKENGITFPYLLFLAHFKKEWRENPTEFKKKVAKCVRKSQEAL